MCDDDDDDDDDVGARLGGVTARTVLRSEPLSGIDVDILVCKGAWYFNLSNT